ncbi:C2 and GRAM domain-containing protein At5g50170 isoform X2 [Ziziphus jujuba]|nr:C2 and GRAM domain-containing protein At5g50170 isoform X2 [Ziziphus jujuba]
MCNSRLTCGKMPEGKNLMKSITKKLFHKNGENTRINEASRASYSELPCVVSDLEDCCMDDNSSSSFEEALEIMWSKDNEHEMPKNLRGGILINQAYALSSNDLNTLFFAPNSQFRKDLAEVQGTTDIQEGPWAWNSGGTSLSRIVTYKMAATKSIKSAKVTEEQKYMKANGREFAVLATLISPDVPHGNSFNVELLYKITPGPDLSSGEESSCLLLSWGLNFSNQSTMLRGMIEGGVRQGLKESYNQFANLLAQNTRVLNSSYLTDKDHTLAYLETENQSDWELAREYFWKLTILTTIFMVVYVLVHILLCKPSEFEGLEFNGLDLPDSFAELVTCGIFVVQLKNVYNMVAHFVQARLQRGGDHGIKAHSDGWILTVALIEGSNLASMGSSKSSYPYVAFTCNGQTRTSSVQFQTCDPQWIEVLEFDTMEEPPSVLDVEVYDFDGPFELAASLGYAEISFLKHSSTELADLWVPLEGKLAQSSKSKLHLRIFLDNNKGGDAVREYLTKMEKEVGKKLNLRSPHKNSTFQKLFGLPPEEFLISDFTCHLKRKMSLQGRLFLSARIVGFYATLFGHKTKFYFLWEDIDDIVVLPPSLASMGSPLLVIILKKGRGLDAKYGAKTQDEEGRLKFYFSFGSFSVACRIIMSMWRTRNLTPEQKAQLAEEQEDQESFVMLDNSGPIQDLEDAKMTRVYSAELPFTMNSMVEIFDGGRLEHRIMEQSGCLNYSVTAWQSLKPDLQERRLSYKFSRHVPFFFGEVTCTQHRSPIANGGGWILDEVMALHGVPFCDHFRIHFRYQIVKYRNTCKCNIYIRVIWIKITKFQQTLTHNIIEKFRLRVKEIYAAAEKEIMFSFEEDNTS